MGKKRRGREKERREGTREANGREREGKGEKKGNGRDLGSKREKNRKGTNQVEKWEGGEGNQVSGNFIHLSLHDIIIPPSQLNW